MNIFKDIAEKNTFGFNAVNIPLPKYILPNRVEGEVTKEKIRKEWKDAFEKNLEDYIMEYQGVFDTLEVTATKASTKSVDSKGSFIKPGDIYFIENCSAIRLNMYNAFKLWDNDVLIKTLYEYLKSFKHDTLSDKIFGATYHDHHVRTKAMKALTHFYNTKPKTYTKQEKKMAQPNSSEQFKLHNLKNLTDEISKLGLKVETDIINYTVKTEVGGTKIKVDVSNGIHIKLNTQTHHYELDKECLKYPMRKIFDLVLEANGKVLMNDSRGNLIQFNDELYYQSEGNTTRFVQDLRNNSSVYSDLNAV